MLRRRERERGRGLRSFAGISIITRNSYILLSRNPFALSISFYPYPFRCVCKREREGGREKAFLILCKLYYFHCLFTDPLAPPPPPPTGFAATLRLSARESAQASGCTERSLRHRFRIKIVSRGFLGKARRVFASRRRRVSLFADERVFSVSASLSRGGRMRRGRFFFSSWRKSGSGLWCIVIFRGWAMSIILYQLRIIGCYM